MPQGPEAPAGLPEIPEPDIRRERKSLHRQKTEQRRIPAAGRLRAPAESRAGKPPAADQRDAVERDLPAGIRDRKKLPVQPPAVRERPQLLDKGDDHRRADHAQPGSGDGSPGEPGSFPGGEPGAEFRLPDRLRRTDGEAADGGRDRPGYHGADHEPGIPGS